MAMIIVPINYFNEEALNLTNFTESPGYELRKAFSTDKNEYTKVSQFEMTLSSIDDDKQRALYILGDGLFSDPEFGITFEQFEGVWASDAPLATYGNTGLIVQGMTQGLWIWGGDTYTQYRLTRDAGVIKTVMFGYVYDLPDSHRLKTQEYSRAYPKTSVTTNLLGTTIWDGWQNTGSVTEHTLEFDYLDSADKDMLIEMFSAAKGGLPVLFVDDEQNESSWIICSMPSLTIREPYTEYFKVTIQLKEF